MNDGKIKIYATSYSEEVTGSNNHVKVEWPNGREVCFVVDCGLFQEKEHNHINAEKFPYKPQNVAFAIATHVHTDHVGRFPDLVKKGFSGKIYCSYETSQLLPVVLWETAERLEDDYRLDLKKYKDSKEKIRRLKDTCNCRGRGKRDKPRREKRKQKFKEEKTSLKRPVLIYDKSDIDAALSKVVVQSLNTAFTPCEGIEITFYLNAHIAGAVLAVCKIFDETQEIYMLFTGDLGLTNPIINTKTFIPEEVAKKIDIIVSESTYGSAEEGKKIEKERAKHMEIIKETHRKKGTIIYMSNSLERPLRVGVDLKDMQENSKIKQDVLDFDIYFDSTFGIKCLRKYVKLFGREYLPENFNVIDKDSRSEALANNGSKMIICTSPRLYQGSFLNYGSRMLENPNVTLIFVAYVPDEVRNIISLPYGTEIDFMGEKVKLRCKRYQFGYYSSHVSTEEMDMFLSQFPNVSTFLFNHGTNDSKNNYAYRYKKMTNTTHNLLYGRTVLLTKNGILKYF